MQARSGKSPQLENGSFEDDHNWVIRAKIDAWHYQRQTQLNSVEDPAAAREGKYYLLLQPTNDAGPAIRK